MRNPFKAVSLKSFIHPFFLVFLLIFNPQFVYASAQKTIAITQIVEHPSLDATRLGLLKALEESGFKEGDTLKVIYENAQGNITTAVQIAQKFIALKPDVIIAIATPSAQTIVSSMKDEKIPVIFAAVSDPLGARLISNLEKPGGNVSGVTDGQPIDEQVQLMKSILPELKRIGVLYNPGEINSIRILERLKKEVSTDIVIVELAASKSHEVKEVTQKLVQEVDALYIPLDNTIVSALPSVLKVAHKVNIPVFSTDPDLVKQGVLASIGSNYTDVGELTGMMCVKVLQGQNVGDMPVTMPKKKALYLNLKTAKHLGISFSEQLLKKAKYKFHS